MVQEIPYKPVIREWGDSCYHRLPQIGQFGLLNCLETYNSCNLLVEKIPVEPEKPKSKSIFARWWNGSKQKPKTIPERIFEYENRYISFIEGSCVIVNHNKILCSRDFGIMNGNMSKPMPAQEFDC
jgi:hypothetical protein